MTRLLSLLAFFAGVPAILLCAADQPLPPREAAARMTLPPGFKTTLFAGEPDVVQPIAFCFDSRGRLWVAECLSYPNWTKEKEGKDRIVIFEDANGKGSFTKRTVFTDKLANVSGINLGFGGVWVAATPNLLFIPFEEGKDTPSGPPRVVLDGWDLNAKHNVFNSLTWGPDGWLYGCNGILSNSVVGKPGTPEKDRIRLNCGVWRYHPTRGTFEVVASGTTNPWGLDFDDYGEAFITNCVISHLWHVVPGAHFQRMFGQDLNPYTYALLNSCADHIHWGGGEWTSSRGGQGSHGVAGGGHAHVGAMIYLGNNWPDRYRGGLFTCNLHGNRVNNDILELQGSSYVAHHGQDFLFANDPWFRGVAIQYGPDGGVYVSDWTDTGECHNYVTVDRTNGRIFKITYGDATPAKTNLAQEEDIVLAALQIDQNEWHVRQARRLLQERYVAGKLSAETGKNLWSIFHDFNTTKHRLRALWALHAIGSLDDKATLSLLKHADEHVRRWAIRLAVDEKKASPAIVTEFQRLAIQDHSPRVRLALASALQSLPPEERWGIASSLLAHREDAQDAYLPLMIWYGIEPLAAIDPSKALKLLIDAKIPIVREHLARRLIGVEEKTNLDALTHLIADKDDPLLHRDILRGIQDALTGRRRMSQPRGWSDAYALLATSPYPEVRQRALALALIFGDAQALASLRETVRDRRAPIEVRRSSLQSLLENQDPATASLLLDLLDDPSLRGPALRGLAAFDHDATPKQILNHYGSLRADEKTDALLTLASRPAYALALIDAMEQNKVPRRDLSAFTVRLMMNLKNKQVSDRLQQVWGTIRPASAEKARLMAEYKTLLTPDFVNKGDRSKGRAIFTKSCAACHRLFEDGGTLGPDLTGSQRMNLSYILEKVLDPSAVVAKDYQMTKLELKNGRNINGVVKREDEKTLTIQTQNEIVSLPKDEIEARKITPVDHAGRPARQDDKRGNPRFDRVLGEP